MEAPTSASLGAMGSLLRKLHVLLASGCRLPEKVKDGMHLLKDDLEEISGCLQDLSEVEDPPLTAKCWMKEVRELSYDIEDYIDKLVRPVRANIKTRFVCKISLVKITRLPKRLKWHQQIANTISEFRIYVQEAIERHERYELHCCTFRRRFVSVGPMLPTPYEETAELVIDGRMNEFINSLANDGDQQLKVVSIVGPECLGKTTLAKMLYNKFGGQFDCRAFIRVSQKPDMKRLFCDILSQVQRQPPPDDCKELDLIDNIRKHLQDKSFLIITDDLWAASVWDIINHAFPEGSRRSRIIITTQIEDVALTCCCYRSEYVFEMKPLDEVHSRKLFFNRLFGSESDCPQQFKEISNKTVEICGGLPLATVHIASLLKSQPVILLELWMYVCDSLSTYLRTNSTSERMKQVLNLSFNKLPHHLKTCLLYLNMYPEGHRICKDDLVKQWVAEGFIDRIEGRDMEKIAGSYFDELIDRRFIQPIDINYNDEVLSCAVHDMVRDLIADKSVEKNFIVVVDYYRKNVEISDKVRRLSLCFGNAKYAKTPANIRTSQVRSLTFFGLCKCMPSITEFKLLRVLNLQLSCHHGDDTLDLTGISELFQLRYLKIACNICIELPNHMRGLQYLETLDMDTKVTTVPWDIIYIPRLLHLRLPVETTLLDWIGSMRSFNEQSLGNLTNLRDLHLTCSTPPSDHLERNMEALGSLLGALGNLKTLALVPGSSHKNVVVRNASEVIVSWDYLAPPLLQRFEWLPQSCIFSSVPKWIGELVNLCTLKIAVRELLRNGVDILKGLPALTALSLYVQTAPVERIVFDKVGFSALKYFKFKCSVPWLKFEADAMPNLRKLMLGFNALGADQHDTKPISIEHLPGLKEISVKIGGVGSDADSALAIAVSSHPRNPRINVQGRSMVTKEKEYVTLEEQDDILQEDPDKYYGTQVGESGEDENKQAGSMAGQEQEYRTLVDQDKIMEDDPDEESGEDENKQTGRRISTLSESSSHMTIPGDLSPGIEGFQIVGEPIPGFTLTACGFPTNGTTLCNFQWVRYLENGIRQSIEGATMYDYVVTADDVGTVLSVDCTPMDDNGRQGELVKEFANNQNKITCGMKNVDSSGSSGPISSQKAQKYIDDYSAAAMAQHEDDWEQRPLDASILYNINGGMPHGRVPIGDGAIKKDAVLVAAKSRNIRPSNSISYRNVIRHNQELLQTQEVHRQMILQGTGTGLGTGSSHVGSQPDDGAVDGNVDVNDRDNCSGDIDGDNNHAAI